MNYETKFAGAETSAELDYDAGYTAPSKTRRNIIIAVVVILAIALTVYFWQSSGAATPAEDAAAAEASQAPTVTVIAPGAGLVERLITASGSLAARRELPVGISGEGGQVVRVLVEPGAWVGAGQVLAIVDQSVANQQVRSQSAQIQVADADARLAQANLDRSLQLVERGFVSKADVDRLTATRDAATARVDVARAQLGELQARGARLNIIAPAAGLVLERNVEPGQVVSSGSGVLFRLAKGGEMELKAQLSEDDLARLSNGVSAEITPVGSGKTFTGQIWQILPVIDPATRQGIARIALSYDPALRPGGFASAVIKGGATTAPVLPESAVQSDDDGAYVYIIDKGNKVVRRNIKTGIVTAKGISVASGLTGSERVVLYAAGFLNPGETVKTKLQKVAS